MSFSSRVVASTALALVVAAPNAAFATDDKVPTTPIEIDRSMAAKEVTDRQHEGYAPLGINLGGFTAYPLVEVTERFTTNLFYEQSRHREDLETSVAPSMRVRSNWSLHEVEFYGNAEFLRHARFTGEDVDNFGGYLSGKFDISEGAYLTANLSADRGHESRSSPDDTGGVSPTETSDLGGTLGGEWRGARTRLKFDLGSLRHSFDNVLTSSGTVVNNHDRNRTETDGGVLAAYEIVPSYFAFVEGRANNRQYVDSRDDNGFDRDSSGYEARIGTDIQLSGVLRGDVYVSYLWQNYQDSRFNQISDMGAGANLSWTPTALTTVKLGASRVIAETTNSGSAGLMQTRLESAVAHELRRNIVLELDGAATNSIYDNSSRNDWLYEGGTKGTYKFNRFCFSSLAYRFARQESNADGSRYSEHSALVKLGGQL